MGLGDVAAKMNGSKKTIAAHGATSLGTIGVIIGFMWTYPNTVPGYAQAQAMAAKADTVVEVQTDVKNLKEGQARLEVQVSTTAQSIARIEGLLAGMAAKENIVLKQNRDTVISYFDINRGNSARAFWRHGPTTDTLMIPVVRDTT